MRPVRATTTTTSVEPTSPTTTPATTPTLPPAAAAPADVPGAPCDPAAGNPDCTDATADSAYRIVEGYAACLAALPGEGATTCADLDGDGHAAFPDPG